MNNGLICVSVCSETADEFNKKVESASEVADLIELRFDCLDKNQIEEVWKARASSKQEISTFRPKEQGGKRDLSFQEREDFWTSGNFTEWADWELELFELKVSFFSRFSICSHHDFNGVPEKLNVIYDRMNATNADVLKIAVQANDATDGLAVMKLLERAKADNKNFIPIAMGESGVWTRILGLSRGAFMTFASLDETGATAPGQLTVQEMIDVYRVKELDENTEIYGLVAESVTHSVSPQMHNAAFKFHNLNAVYVPFAVKNLEEFMRRMVNPKTREIDWKLRGLSVTNPHKVEIMKYLDFVDETAQKIGAVNTVKITESGELRGFNTDAQGFIEPLKNTYGDIKNCKVAILGAGGAARACVYALKQEGAEVTIFARNLEKAEALATEFDVAFAQLDEEVDFKPFNILVNATPLGTKKGGLENEAPAKTVQLGGLKLLYDLVYNPQTTKLMREAQAVFVPTLGGLSMLVAQAMIQQKIWTGLDAPMKEMGAAALRKLEGVKRL